MNWVYAIAALAPSLFLMQLIYRQDKIEKEPRGLLFKLMLGGCLSTVVALLLELIGECIIGCFVESETVLYGLLDAFLVVGFSEEFAKLFFLKKFSWKHPAFNYRFDGIVYAVFTSLGFAALENIFYVIDGGLSTALLRAVLSIPGHLCFSVFMGYFYGRAKLFSNMGDQKKCKRELRKSLISAIFAHGLYDACLFVDTTLSVIIFFVSVVIMDLIIYRLVKRESKTDVPIA